MKKLISLAAALSLLITGATIGSSAAESIPLNVNSFYYGNKEITIDAVDISQEKMQFIADFIVDEPNNTYDEVAPCGIACLFGHKLTKTSATETSHNAYSSSPKCLVKIYNIEYCTRSSCDYIKKDLISSYRTSTCHG